MAFLLDDILLAPCKLVHWVGKTLYENAEEQMTDDSAIRRELLELQIRLELDDISEDECHRQEAVLMQQLDAVRAYKESRKPD
ncbi:MAG: gas vesicle protein GvpG [Candidatus Rokubacteria bacterium]|jgi:hypothetical protein|nr:gas vesicle protein GvpG [Candidatus Rokubacteria bacterium]